jgi:hypothetical protein
MARLLPRTCLVRARALLLVWLVTGCGTGAPTSRSNGSPDAAQNNSDGSAYKAPDGSADEGPSDAAQESGEEAAVEAETDAHGAMGHDASTFDSSMCLGIFESCMPGGPCCAPYACINLTGTFQCQVEGPALDAAR